MTERKGQKPVFVNGIPEQPIRINLSLQSVNKAIETAKSLKPFLVAGKVWSTFSPRGEVEVKGAVLYENRVISVIEFDPKNGQVLPKGYHPFGFKIGISLEKIQTEMPNIIKELDLLNGAEYREPEYCWIIPLSYKGMIVAHVKVYYDGIHVVPDYKAEAEMKAFAK